MGDKYYSIGKFLSAAKSYEKAKFYYDKFTRKDPVVESSIKNRIKNRLPWRVKKILKRIL